MSAAGGRITDARAHVARGIGRPHLILGNQTTMQRFALLLLRLLGIARPQPKTAFGRQLRRAERVALVAFLLYGALHAYPQPLFAHSVTAGEITLYSRQPLPAATVDRLAQARMLVAQSELAIANRPARVFLCNSPWLYRVFAPLKSGSFAISIPLTNNIFIADADVAADLATSSSGAHRSFSGVVAHEITHDLIRQRLGIWRPMMLPDWVVEGYCDHVSRSGSYPEARGQAMLTAGQPPDSDSARYYLHRRMVAHLVDDRHLSFAQVVARSREGTAVEREARAAARGTP